MTLKSIDIPSPYSSGESFTNSGVLGSECMFDDDEIMIYFDTKINDFVWNEKEWKFSQLV